MQKCFRQIMTSAKFPLLFCVIFFLAQTVYGAMYLAPDKDKPDIKVELSNSFEGGQNDRDEIDRLKETEAALLQNAMITRSGSVDKRNGITTLGDDVGNLPCLGLHRHTHVTAGERYLAAFATVVYKLNTAETAWTSIATGLTTGLQTFFLSTGDYAFIMNGTDRIRYYNASAETTTAFGAGATDPPLAKVGVYVNNRVFLVSETTPSRIRYSNLGDPLVYPAANEILVNENDGQRINALFIFGNDMLVFKDRSIWSVNISESDYLTALTVSKLENQYGTKSPRSVRQLGRDVIFLDQFGDVRSLQKTVLGAIQAGAVALSDKIRGTLDLSVAPTTKGINREYIGRCAAEVWRDQYIFSYPNNTSTTNNRCAVWDGQFQAWATLTGWNAACFERFTLDNASGNPTDYLVMGEAGNNSLVYKCFQGTSDNGVAIDFDVRTKEFTTDWIGSKEFKLVEVACNVGVGDLLTDANVDRSGWTNQGSLVLEGDAPSLPQTLPFNLGSDSLARSKYHLSQLGRAYGIQFRFRNNTTTDTVSIRHLIVFGRILPYMSE